MPLTGHSNHRYHVEMMLAELTRLITSPRTDTRVYLSLDMHESAIIQVLLTQELAAIDRTLANAG